MTEMIERVARAIYLRQSVRRGDVASHSWESFAALGKIGAGEFRADARAAIEAMREPTPEMHNAGTERDDGGDQTNSIGVYQAMIEAALAVPNGDN